MKIPLHKSGVQACERIEEWLTAHAEAVAALAVVCGLLLRLHAAQSLYLNPDEGHHYGLASQHVQGLKRLVDNAMGVAHPPLFILLVRALLRFGSSEVMLRLTSVVTGALFPWLVMAWVRRFAGSVAGLSALLILTFSPAFVNLGSELRGYAPAFLCVSLALLLLDRALEGQSAATMALFHVALYAAILLEYCVAWFAGAAGVYALLRLWGHSQGRAGSIARLRIIWIAGQAVALGLYSFLYVAQISAWVQDSRSATEGYLRDAFLQPGGHAGAFALIGTLAQFMFLFANGFLACLMAIAFLLGVYLLWRKKLRLEVLLIVLPFALACLGGILHVFPYGASRQTSILGIFAAAGLGQAISTFARNKTLPVILAATVLMPAWIRMPPDFLTVPAERHRMDQMQDSIRFLRTRVPPGSVVLTDRGTYYTLLYYFAGPNSGAEPVGIHERTTRQAGGLRFVVSPEFEFSSDSALRAEVNRARSAYGMKETFWVAVGGFRINVTDPTGGADRTAIAIFKAPEENQPTSKVPPLGTPKT